MLFNNSEVPDKNKYSRPYIL